MKLRCSIDNTGGYPFLVIINLDGGTGGEGLIPAGLRGTGTQNSCQVALNWWGMEYGNESRSGGGGISVGGTAYYTIRIQSTIEICTHQDTRMSDVRHWVASHYCQNVQ